MKKHKKKIRTISLLCLVLTIITVPCLLWFVPFCPENAIRLYLLKDMKPLAAFLIHVKPMNNSCDHEELYYVTTGDYLPQLSVTHHEMRYWIIRRGEFGYSAEWDSGPGN